MELPTVTGVLSEQLRNEILIGKLPPREKINEIKLAKDLGISRSPLREVFRMMENERLVENIPRKGTFVTDVSLKDFMEIYEIREMIECRAIDIFEKNSVRELPLVEKAVENETQRVLPPPDSSPLDILAHLQKMFEYHLSIVESLGNMRLYVIFKNIHFNVLRYHYLNMLVNVTQERATEHIEIIESIKTGDYVNAKRILKAHIKDHSEKIIEKLRKREEG